MKNITSPLIPTAYPGKKYQNMQKNPEKKRGKGEKSKKQRREKNKE
jgi:hypothetical protein